MNWEQNIEKMVYCRCRISLLKLRKLRCVNYAIIYNYYNH